MSSTLTPQRPTPALVLLVIGWIVLAVGLAADARRGSPEGMLRGYLADLEGRRVEVALAVLAPDVRERWRDFVEFQQFNRYRVVSVAVRSPSLLESLGGGRPWRATEVTLVADIVEPSGTTWRGSTVVPLESGDGRWTMRRPPFAGE